MYIHLGYHVTGPVSTRVRRTRICVLCGLGSFDQGPLMPRLGRPRLVAVARPVLLQPSCSPPASNVACFQWGPDAAWTTPLAARNGLLEVKSTQGCVQSVLAPAPCAASMGLWPPYIASSPTPHPHLCMWTSRARSHVQRVHAGAAELHPADSGLRRTGRRCPSGKRRCNGGRTSRAAGEGSH